MSRINIANRITLGRLVLTLLLLALLSMVQGGVWGLALPSGPLWLAVLLFVVASATDWLDGYLARSRNIVTAFGRIADPFVDKMLVSGCLVLLASITESGAILRPWMVVVIIAREFLVNGIRGWMESSGINFQAAKPGKYKFAAQAVSITLLLVYLALGANDPSLAWINVALVWLMLALTIYSGGFYVHKAWRSSGGLEL